MSPRPSQLTVLALPALLLLGACDGNPLRTAAPKADCCCSHCPGAAPPTATPAKPTKAGGVTRAVATGGEARTWRTRGGPVVTTGGGYVSYYSSEGGGYGGRYGARGGGGRTYGGVSVSVTESESASSRYSYSESSSGYAYGSGGGGYGYGPGGARVSSDPPHHPGYRAAQTDREGYLTWPGKVED